MSHISKMDNILECEPPHPIISVVPEYASKLSKDLSSFQDIDFTAAMNDDQIIRCFQNLNGHLSHEKPMMCIRLINFLLSNITEKLFPLFIENFLISSVTSALEKISREQITALKELDDVIFSFLHRLIIPFMKVHFIDLQTNDQNSNKKGPIIAAMNNFQLFIAKSPKLPKSGDLLRAIHVSQRLTYWIAYKNKDGVSLEIILNAILPARINELPLPLSSEIARCLVIVAATFDLLECGNLLEIKRLLVSAIAKFLKYKPESFANPSTISCLMEIKTHSFIAPPLSDALDHAGNVELNSILQLVRFWLFIIGTNNKQKLLDMCSLCPALQSDIFARHSNKFIESNFAMNFFKQSLVTNTVADFIKYESIPKDDDFHNMAIFLRSHSNEKLKPEPYTNKLGVLLSNVYKTINSLPVISSDIDLMISCAKIVSSLISFEQLKIEGFERISPHFFQTAVAVAEAIIASPLYPHSPTSNYMSSLLQSSFEELAAACAGKPKEFLTYLLNVSPSLGKCMLFTVGLNYPFVRDNYSSTWKNLISNNIESILRFGLSLLKIPRKITIQIVAKFYLTIINFALKMQLSHKLLYGILDAPLNIFNSVSDNLIKMEPINQLNDFVCFLDFYNIIFENPFIKSFFIANANGEFWKNLKFFVSSPLSKISVNLTNKALNLLTKLSDYSNSINPRISSGQRIFIDTLHYSDLIDFISLLNNILPCDYQTNQEKCAFAQAISELLLSWCYPLPILLIVKGSLTEGFIKEIQQLIQQPGSEYPEIENTLSQVEKCFNISISEKDAAKCIAEFVKLEEHLPQINSSKKLCSMYFKIIDSINCNTTHS